MSNFYERAAKLGHSRELLEKGVAIQSRIVVENVEQLRELLDLGLNKEGREKLVEEMFEGIPTPPGDTAAGLLNRVEKYLYGNAELSHETRRLIESLFPMTISADSNPNETISTKYLLTSPDSVYVKNWGTLTLADGGCLIANSKGVQITIEKLIRTGKAPQPYSDINILGTTGAAGATGGTGGTGGQGDKGKDGYCSSGGIAGPGGENGKTGGQGIVGGTGGTGSDGSPSQLATIEIFSFGSTGTISVATRSGTGGAGGKGGTGGRGGTGGKGGNGVTCACTGNGAGSGARGGTGGTGGRGGQGGNAVAAAANVVIRVPAQNISQIFPLSAPVPPGSGGPAGVAGAGGPGGGGGSGGKYNGNASGGSTGAGGVTGTGGTGGTQSGAAAKINIEPL
ncbi:MAG: hypothetical protein JO340_19725 [Acidobacteriaceae bacterium]|nr:hypothetical protein [Acidobacteriaceae bacterium]